MTTNLYTAEQVRKLDRILIQDQGIDSFILMQQAARFTFHTLVKKWPNITRIHVFCGNGNNAGDGYILAAIAKKRGFEVNVHYLLNPDKLENDARLAYQYCNEANVSCQPFSKDTSNTLTKDCSFIIIDALLGTGLNSEVVGKYKHAIELCNETQAPTLSIDIPSGLSANTGNPVGIAVIACCTASFIALKQGMFTGAGRDYCGEIFFDNLGVTTETLNQVPCDVTKLQLSEVLTYIKPRALNTHKGHFGHVLLVGGDHGYGGAIILAAEAALRMGAGLVSVATQKEHIGPILARQPEIMAKAVSNRGELSLLVEAASVLIVGPGLGKSSWSQQMLNGALLSNKTIILDADALNLLSKNPDWLTHDDIILTPHPGEAARLITQSTQAIQHNRFKSVTDLQRKWAGSVLLKGSGSLICHSRGTIKVCPYGNPGMASGGMGDVLTGIIGGLIAQGLPKEYALELAVCLHAKAADIAVNEKGQKGLVASDLIPIARLLLNTKRPDTAKDFSIF